MKSLRRLGALTLISVYAGLSLLPSVALAQSKPLPTCTITATPPVISPGGTITLKWTSTNATAGAITNVGNVEPNGSKQIMPSLAQVTTYVGSFTGPGGTANCVASVQINYGVSSGDSGTVGEPTAAVPNPVGSQAPANNATPDGLVQCGRGYGIAATNCQACELARLVQNIINFLIGLSIPIAALLFAWAGVLYFTSADNAGNIQKAKDIFKNALIGFVIVITAWLVVNTLLHALLDGGKLFQGGSNWFTVKCTGNRPVDKTINQVINSVLPGVNTSVPQGSGGIVSSVPQGVSCSEFGCFYSDQSVYSPADGTGGYGGSSGVVGSAGLCPSGYTYTDNAEEYWCQNPTNPDDWVEARAQREYARGYAQCDDSNPNCSIGNLQSQGLTQAQSNAMSCIAMTENSGQAYGCSGTGPCGTFQISETNWKQYAPASCSANAFGGNLKAAQNNGPCNLQVAAIMVKAQGYQPWTGNNNGVYWNPSARTCVSNYDPTNLR